VFVKEEMPNKGKSREGGKIGAPLRKGIQARQNLAEKKKSATAKGRNNESQKGARRLLTESKLFTERSQAFRKD